MTGYGSAKGQAGDLQISVEVKSVNNRYLDASVRMPRSFLFAEDAVKSAIGRHISRGKVDMFINVDSSAADDMSVKVNEALLKGYIDAINLISGKFGLENDLTAADTIKGIIDRIHELESSPEAGALSSSTALAENIYRYLSCDDYTVFYRYEDDTVYIVRVMYCIADNII